MQYSKKVMKHFEEPHNQGKIADATVIGEVGNPLCGDIMKIYLKIDKSKSDERLDDVIKDIKFETFGCAAAIACSSILTDMADGKNLKDAFDIEKKDIVNNLGELPPVKIHCSILASDGLKLAIQSYLRDQGVLDNYSYIKKFKIIN